MRAITHYEILGLDKTADKEAVKKRYKELCLIWHPDKAKEWSPDLLKEKVNLVFSRIHEAYQVLSKDAERKQYDKFGSLIANNSDEKYKAAKEELETLYQNYLKQMENPLETFGDFLGKVSELEWQAKQMQKMFLAQARAAQKEAEKKISILEEENRELRDALAKAEKEKEALDRQAQNLLASLSQSQHQMELLTKKIESLEKQAPTKEALNSPRLFTSPVLRSKEAKKIVPPICIIQRLETPPFLGTKDPKTGMLFVGVSLVFERPEHGEPFREALYEASQNNPKYSLTTTYSPYNSQLVNLKKEFGIQTTFFDLELCHFKMIAQNPRLNGLFQMIALEKLVDISKIPQKLYYMNDSKFIDIKAPPAKMRLEGVERIILTLGHFFHHPLMAFLDFRLVFKTAEKAKVFQNLVDDIMTMLDKNAPFGTASLLPESHQDDGTVIQIKSVSSTELTLLLFKNPYVQNVILLHAFEQFFDTTGIEKAIFNSSTRKWLDQEAESTGSEFLKKSGGF